MRLLLAATALLATACSASTGAASSASPAPPPLRLGLTAPSAPPSALPSALAYPHRWTASLDYVVDGDTQRMVVDLGGVSGADRGLWSHLDVVHRRLLTDVDVRDLGFNAAEHGTVGGDAATAYGKTWFADNPGPYTLTSTRSEAQAFDKYGRFLGIVTAADGQVYNVDIVHAGFGAPYNGTGPRPTPAYPPVPDPSASPAYA